MRRNTRLPVNLLREGKAMSMDRCTQCSHIVDTDFDTEFYDFAYLTENNMGRNGYGGHCESCREAIYNAMTPAQQAEHEKKIYG